MDKKYKPLVDKLYFIIFIPTAALVVASNLLAIFAPTVLLLTIPIALFTLYFFISPLFGYVVLRDEGLLIRYGFFLTKEIPYSKIRSVRLERKWYTETMLSLKSSFDHILIRYNSFDTTAVSVKDNDELIGEILGKNSIIIHEQAK